jgi:hypothetical protein
MLAASSADLTPTLDVSARTRLAMVALGFIPALHVLASVAPLAFAATGRASWRMAWLTPVIVFLAPPLLVRLSAFRRPLPTGVVAIDSPAFLQWWFSAQCQIVFSRLTFLEELLRLVPGLYSLWLRLWGARVGALVYWSPGVAILDRSLIRIGSRVVFGVGVRLNPHVLAPGPQGRAALHLASISIGDDVLVGGYSLLLPGCAIADGEATPPFKPLHAFSRFEGGRRVPKPGASSVERGL